MVQPRRFTKMPFEGSASITAAIGQLSYAHVFRGSSIYDPDYLNVTKGTSVDGYVLAGSIYRQYRVYGVKAQYTFYNTSAIVVQCTLVAGNETSFPTTTYITDLANRNGAKSIVLGPAGSSKTQGVISKYYSCADLTGQTKEQYRTDATNSAYVTANPTNPTYVGYAVGGLPETSASPAVVTVRIKLIYYVELFDLIDGVMSP